MKSETYLSSPTKPSEVDINNYSFKVYGFDSNLIMKWAYKEKTLSATKRERLSRMLKISSIIHKHKIVKEGLTR